MPTSATVLDNAVDTVLDNAVDTVLDNAVDAVLDNAVESETLHTAFLSHFC